MEEYFLDRSMVVGRNNPKLDFRDFNYGKVLNLQAALSMPNAHIFMGEVVKLFSNKIVGYEGDKTSLLLSGDNLLLSTYTNGKINKEVIDKKYYSWSTDSNDLVFNKLLDIITTSTNNEFGRNFSNFDLAFSDDYFKIGDTIHNGAENKSLALYVLGVRQEGSRYIYTVRLENGSINNYITRNQLFIGDGNYTLNYSRRGQASESGSGNFPETLGVKYMQWTNKIRKQETITDAAAQEINSVIQLDFSNSKGSSKQLFMGLTNTEVKLLRKFYSEMNYLLTYSRLSEVPMKDPDSHDIIYPMSGLEEQILRYGNITTYNPQSFTVGAIEDYFSNLYATKSGPSEIKFINAYTGMGGLLTVNKVLKDYATRIYTMNSDQFIKKNTTINSNDNYTAGHRFSEFVMPFGGIIRFNYSAQADNRLLNREPYSRSSILPKSSYKIIIPSLVESETNNIKIIEKKDTFSINTVAGRFDSRGKSTGDNAKNLKDASASAISGEYTIAVMDPSRTVMYNVI